ncbi:MAG: hypothetical protein LQ352_000391 [Teloschistes flavicans]|nr:MAG: hypothetical protein LQ352_000391 [Teloschistes flavicans]
MHSPIRQHGSAARVFVFSCLYILAQLQLLVQATDADTTIHEDHNHHRLLDLLDQSDVHQGLELNQGNYEPQFAALGRDIIGRAQQAATTLANNAPQPTDIDQGDIQFWIFPKSISQGPFGQLLEPPLPLNHSATNTTCLERDLIALAQNQTQNQTNADGSRTIYLTISTCDQPNSTATSQGDGPPQLEVYVSRATNNQQPDKGHNDKVLTMYEGYGCLTLTGVIGDIWIGVRAPTASGFDGMYNYELTASIDANYTTVFVGDTNSLWDTQITSLDTDTNSSILGTGDITNEMNNSSHFDAWLGMQPPPFSVYVNELADPALLGLQRSICGLRKHAQVKDSDKKMVRIGGQPNQLFYVENLKRNTSYNATMTLERPSGNSTIGGGGSVWRATNFSTKSGNNCKIIYDLPFCSDVAYAVPSNPDSTFNMTNLARIYDDHVRDAYQNFDKSLQQIPCDTTPSAQYSLARNCNDCANAYKAWLCAVSIPRCADYPPPQEMEYLVSRNLTISRNKEIVVDVIKTGPYSEMLPCKDLCYHLMQNCPAALQFACPLEGRGLNYSYGHWEKTDKEWMCNWPGGPKLWNGARPRVIDWGMMALLLAAAVYVS